MVNAGGATMGTAGVQGTRCSGGDCGVAPGQACGMGNACGAGGAGCGVGETTNVLSYVGSGGDYTADTTYKYVGQGAGEFSVVSVPTSAQNWLWCIIPCILLPLLALLLLLWPKGTDARAEVLPGPPGKCMFWGDPHFWTFDNPGGSKIGNPEDAYPNGDFWIVKTPDVWIQGRYRPTKWLMTRGNDRACTRAVAVGGPFMQNSKLIIEAMQESTTSAAPGKMTYNGQPILTTFPSTFSAPGGSVTAKYHNQGASLDPRMTLPLHIVDVTLPQGVQLTVNRWTEHIDGQITMSAVPGMTGHCGNFDGNPSDDQSATVDAWGAHKPLLGGPVSPSELLFAPTTFVDQHNFPKIVPEEDTYNSRTGK